MNEDPEGISPGESQQAEGAGGEVGAAPRPCRLRETRHRPREGGNGAGSPVYGKPPVNRDLVRAGAMLHDIGRGVTHGIDHAQRGAALAGSLGLDERIVSIIERHIGAGLTADECSLARLIPRDCLPVTIEEKIVANADNLVHGKQAGTIEGTLEGAIPVEEEDTKEDSTTCTLRWSPSEVELLHPEM